MFITSMGLRIGYKFLWEYNMSKIRNDTVLFYIFIFNNFPTRNIFLIKCKINYSLTLKELDYFRNSACGAWPKHSDWKSSQIWTFGSLRVSEASSMKTPRPNRAPCFARSAQESRWAAGCWNFPRLYEPLKTQIIFETPPVGRGWSTATENRPKYGRLGL